MGDISPQYQVAANASIPEELSPEALAAAHHAMLRLAALIEKPGKVVGAPPEFV